MIALLLLPILSVCNVFLIYSLDKNEFRKIIFYTTSIIALIIFSWFYNFEVFKIWVFSLYIYPYYLINTVINKFMNHPSDDSNFMRIIQKFMRDRVIYALLIFYQIFMTIQWCGVN
jgi:hypothetical protein